VRNQLEQLAAVGKWVRYVPPKRRFTQDLHGTTSQKTVLLNGEEKEDSKRIRKIMLTTKFSTRFSRSRQKHEQEKAPKLINQEKTE
jgi:hypothetical protein